MKRPMFEGEVVLTVCPPNCGHFFPEMTPVVLAGGGAPCVVLAVGPRFAQIVNPDEYRPFYDEE